MAQHLKLVKLLRKAYPTLKVRLGRPTIRPEFFGKCICRGKNDFLLQLDRSINGQTLTDTIIHEFAHCAAWDEWQSTGDHGPVWGQHYAKCYKIWEQNFTS